MNLPTLHRLLSAAAPCVAALLSTGLAPSASAQSAEKITYQDHVLPIFRNACNNCHNSDKKRAGLDLSTYQSTLAGSDNGSMINAGDPSGSMLFKTMTHAVEPTMPPKRDKLPQAELEIVRKWIAGGLLETATGKAAPMTKPKVDLGVVAVSGRPTGPIAFPTGLTSEPIVRTSRPGAVESIASSPWAPVVAVGGQKQIILYHSETLEVVGVLPFNEGVPRVLRFSRNGSLLLAAGGQGAKLGKVVLYDVATGNRVTDVGDELDEVLAADISGDQKVIALGGPSRLVRGYSVADGKELYAIKKHTDWITSIAISPDGKLLASGDRAGNLHVWEADGGGELYNLVGHKDSVNGLQFRGDSMVLASVSADGSMKLWEMAEGKQIKTTDAHAKGVSAVSYTHDGRLVTTGRDKTVKVWDATGGAPKPLAPAFTDVPMQVTFDSEGQRVFAGDWSGVVRVWQVSDGKMVGELSPNPPPIADRLAAAAKKLADAEPNVTKFEAELKAAQAASSKAADDLAKLNGSIENLKKEIATLDGKVKAGPEQTNASQKALAAATEKSAAADKLLAKAQAAVKDAERQAKLPAAAAAVDTKALEADLKQKEQSLAEARTAAKAAEDAFKAGQQPNDAGKAAWDEAKARVERRQGRVAEAKKALEEATAKSATSPNAAGEAALAKAKDELAKAEKDAASARQAMTDATAAATKMKADAKTAEAELAKAKADLSAAEKQVKPGGDALKAAADKVVPAQKQFDDAKLAMVTLKYDVAKLTAAQAGSKLAEAKKTLQQREDARNTAEQGAKDAVALVEKSRADVAAFQKARQESPATIQKLTAALPDLRKKLADATVPAENASRELSEKETLAKQAAELVRLIQEQGQKAREPSKPLADAETAGKQVLEHLAGDINTAKEKAAKWEAVRKQAEAEMLSAEQTIAREKSDTENAAKILADLQNAVKAAEADVPVKQQAAKDSGKPIEEAKAAVDQAKAEHDRLSAEAAKLAPPAPAKG